MISVLKFLGILATINAWNHVLKQHFLKWQPMDMQTRHNNGIQTFIKFSSLRILNLVDKLFGYKFAFNFANGFY